VPVLTIPDANWTCAVEDPSEVVRLLAGEGGVTKCAVTCTFDKICVGFNMKMNDSKELCEIYANPPTRFALVPGCQYRQVGPSNVDGGPSNVQDLKFLTIKMSYAQKNAAQKSRENYSRATSRRGQDSPWKSQSE